MGLQEQNNGALFLFREKKIKSKVTGSPPSRGRQFSFHCSEKEWRFAPLLLFWFGFSFSERSDARCCSAFPIPVEDAEQRRKDGEMARRVGDREVANRGGRIGTSCLPDPRLSEQRREPMQSIGVRSRGRLFLAYFLLAKQKKVRPRGRGATPSQRNIRGPSRSTNIWRNAIQTPAEESRGAHQPPKRHTNKNQNWFSSVNAKLLPR